MSLRPNFGIGRAAATSALGKRGRRTGSTCPVRKTLFQAFSSRLEGVAYDHISTSCLRRTMGRVYRDVLRCCKLTCLLFRTSYNRLSAFFHPLKQLTRPGAADFSTLRQRTDNLAGVLRRFHQRRELLASERTDFLPFALHIFDRILPLLAPCLEAMTEDA